MTFAALLSGSPLVAAETAKERRQRIQEEKKQRAEETAEERRKDAELKVTQKAMRQQTAAKVVKLKEHGFQFSTVGGWMVGEAGGTPGVVSGVVYIGPKTDINQPLRNSMMVRVLPLEQGKSLDDVIAAGTKELNCHGPHYKVEPGEDLDVAGEPARTLVFEPQEDSVKGTKAFIAAAQHGENAYVFWVMSTPDDFETIRPQAEKMIRSTKWLDGKPTVRDAAAKAGKSKPSKGSAKKQSSSKTKSAPTAETKTPDAGAKDTPASPPPADGDGLD